MTLRQAPMCVQTIGFYGLSGRGFNNPVDMAMDSRGVLYVLNRAGPEVESRMNYKRVTVCNLDEDYLGTFSTGGTADGQLMWPCSIAIGRDDRIYISDEALHRISIFDREGTFLGKWGAFGDGHGQFNRPAGIAFDPDGNLLVVDGANHRVQRYTKDGTYMSSFGSYGSGPGQLCTPWGICLDNEANIYVADWRNDRIQKFSPAGDISRYLRRSGRRGWPVQQAIGCSGGRFRKHLRSGLGKRAGASAGPRRNLPGQDAGGSRNVQVGPGIPGRQRGRAGGAVQG